MQKWDWKKGRHFFQKKEKRQICKGKGPPNPSTDQLIMKKGNDTDGGRELFGKSKR